MSSGCSLIGHSLAIFLFIATSQLNDEHNCYLPQVMNVLQCWNCILHICLLVHVRSCTCITWYQRRNTELHMQIMISAPRQEGNLPGAAEHLSPLRRSLKRAKSTGCMSVTSLGPQDRTPRPVSEFLPKELAQWNFLELRIKGKYRKPCDTCASPFEDTLWQLMNLPNSD